MVFDFGKLVGQMVQDWDLGFGDDGINEHFVISLLKLEGVVRKTS
jgi:hypothetical protein